MAKPLSSTKPWHSSQSGPRRIDVACRPHHWDQQYSVGQRHSSSSHSMAASLIKSASDPRLSASQHTALPKGKICSVSCK